MKVTGSTIQQLDKGKDGRKPKGKCGDWKLWTTTEQGRKSRRFHGTWTQATQALSAFVAELEGMAPNAETFGAYAASWARWRAESGELTTGTVANDKRALAAFSRAGMDDWQMDSITSEMCREALLLIKSHPADGRVALLNTTMNKLHIALSQIFRQAVDDERRPARWTNGGRFARAWAIRTRPRYAATRRVACCAPRTSTVGGLAIPSIGDSASPSGAAA